MLALSATRVFFCSVVFFFVFFAHGFVRVFVIFAHISLTIVTFVVLVPTFTLLRTWAYNFVVNIHTVKIHIIQVQMFISISEVLKILYVIFNKQGQVLTPCFNIHVYIPY